MKDDASEETLDQISKREKNIQAFLNRFEGWLGRSLNKTLRRLQSGSVSAAEAANVLGGIEQALKKLGLDDELAEIETLYGEELKGIKKALKAYIPRGEELLTAADEHLTNALIDFDTDAISKTFEKTVGDLRGAIMRSVIGGEQVDIEEIQDRYGDKFGTYVGTELRTGLSAFNQTVINEKSSELGLELWLYIGPEDSVTRPFCDAVLAKSPPIYTTEERAALNSRADAPAGLPVEVYGGGYNCRHQWVPISEDVARNEYGWKG